MLLDFLTIYNGVAMDDGLDETTFLAEHRGI